MNNTNDDMNICPLSKKICSESKVLHITDIKDGNCTQMNLCKKCADSFESNEINLQIKVPVIDDNKLQEILSVIKKLLNDKFENTLNIPNDLDNLFCPKCKSTHKDIYKNSKLGCPECYEYYSSIVQILLMKCQDENKHVGKIPSKFIEQQEKIQLEKELSLDIKDQIANLKNKMKNAIDVENYEIAGVLKIKIEELQQQLPD